MDASSVLLALDEQKKWRERRKRIRDRLRQLERRRNTLRKELDGVRKKILEYNRLLTDMRDQMPTRAVLPPSAPGR
jgi:predicted  nucleic acid-binding Zn-ribbon protein